MSASLLAAAISCAGIAAIASFGNFAQKNSAYFSAFAVGLLSTSVLFHLVLEALSLSPYAFGWIAAGFALMVLVGIIVQFSVTQRAEGAALTFGYASIIALSVHSFIDGVIYAAVFQAEPFTGWIATAGLLLHEFPEGVIAYFLLYQAGLSATRSSMMAIGAASLTTIAGTLTANSVLALTQEAPMGAMLGGAAGALGYVLIFHLIPHAAKAPSGRGFLLAQVGVLVGSAAIILEMVSGGHGH